MKYIKITWEQPWNETPCEIYTEVGDNNLEKRKVEIYKDGKVAYAHHDLYPGCDVEAGTFLSYEEYPSLDSINEASDSRETIFAVYITKEEFEKIWFRFVNAKYQLQILEHIVRESPTGHLPLSKRIALYEQINDSQLIHKIFFECVKKIFPVWRKEFPTYTPMDKVMEDIFFYLYKNEDRVGNFMFLADKYSNYVDAINSQAGMAAASIIWLCYSIYADAQEVLERENYKGEDDYEFEYADWTTDYLAELAWVDRENTVTNIHKRKEFWLWFIEMVTALLKNPSQSVLPLEVLTNEQEQDIEFERTQTWQTPTIQEHLELIAAYVMEELFEEDKEPGRDWEKCIVRSSNFKTGISKTVHLVDMVGKQILFPIIDIEIPMLFQKIKKEMYNQAPMEGGFLHCTYTFSAYEEEESTIEFHYDRQDLLDEIESNPATLKAEFKAYPRSKEFTPIWWQSILGKNANYLTD